MPRRNRSPARRLIRIVFWSSVFLAFAISWFCMIRMPGKSFQGTARPLSPDELTLRSELMADVQKLGGEIGERNLRRYPKLQEAADYIENQLSTAKWKVRRASYEVNGQGCDNIEAELVGDSAEIVVIGAHYDSVLGSPGANDNGSGVAALLALARRFATTHNKRTLRFVAFTNEEPGYFQTNDMGSFRYAAGCRQRGDRIVAMISLETIGYFSSERGSQHFPVVALGLVYPRIGNFIAFVGNVASRSLLHDVIGEFRRQAQIPSEGGALPEMVPGVGWSDQWSFWQHGYPGIMVTDTAPFRYPHYHSDSDTPDKLDYDSMTRVVSGLEKVVAHLVNPSR